MTPLLPLLFACATPGGDWPPDAPAAVLAEDVGALPPSVRAEPAADGRWRVTFVLLEDHSAERVNLAGSFNDWSSDRTPLARGADGRLRATVEMDGGTHRYKFVLDGERWIRDGANPRTEDDGLGGQNSVLRLGALANDQELDARVGDGSVVGPGLRHDAERPLYRQALGDEGWLLRFRTLANDVEGVAAVFSDGAEVELGRTARVDRFDYWEAVVEGRDLEYTFVVTDGDAAVRHPSTWRLPAAHGSVFRTPDWAKDAIWYQLIVDRFRNGSSDNDPEPVHPWTSDWHRAQPWEERGGRTLWQWSIFERLYGGDLDGLEARLDHLEALGVTALYLNPVFQAPSHHKYDGQNYVHIDEHYGGGDDYPAAEASEDLLDPSSWTWTEADRRFLQFVDVAHERGFHVVIDAVFNHVGTSHPAFRDVRENGADSRFADWFDVRSWEPFEYAGWAGFGGLPVFAKKADGLASDAVKAHVFAVTERWMDPNGDGDPSDGVDGWRLDVPNEIAMPFWADWRAHVKSINPDAYISGEIWHRADTWLDGRHFDAVMNYPFAENVIAWVGNERDVLPPSELDQRLAELRLAYPAEATYALMNLVDSHDTDRLVSMLANPDRTYDHHNRVQDGAPYDESKPGDREYRRARLVALVQMTYVGAPMIYYGDEVGMWGADDPSCRKPMLWTDLAPYARPRENAVDEEHLDHYRRVVGLRRAHSALRRGSFRTVLVDDERDLWGFVREDARERVLVLLNASDARQRVDLPPGEWTSVWGDDDVDRADSVRVPAIGGRVLVETRS